MKNRFDELRRSSWSMPEGKQKLAVLEEMIRIADQYMTEEDAYDTRIRYMTAAIEAGCEERMLIAFAWCLSKFEKSPEQYSKHELMWHYKWVINQVGSMPEINLEQVERIYEDFKQKCLQYGFTLRPYYHKKVDLMLLQGRHKEAADFYKLWRSTPRDGLADCKACEQNLFGRYLFQINHLKRALQVLKPILEGKMSCRTIPQNTYSQMIVPLLKLKEYEQATMIAKKSQRLMKGPKFITEQGIFLEFYTVTNLSKAVDIYNETIRHGIACKIGWDRFHYLLSVRIFLREWHKKKRRKKLAESELVTLSWLDQEIAALADSFNRRNGNTYMNELIVEKDKNTQRLIKAYQLK